MKVTRVLTTDIKTSTEESPLRSSDQLVPGVLLCGGGFNNVWLVVARNGDELDMQRLPLVNSVVATCLRGEHRFKSTGYTFGKRCEDCGFLRTRIAVDQPLGLVVTVGPPAAYVVKSSGILSTPERGVVYSDGKQFFQTSGSPEADLTWSGKSLPLVPDLFIAWEAPAYWRDKL